MPVAVDQTTIRRQSLDGPRVQIMLDMQKDPRDSIDIILPDGSSIKQHITFEHLPKICHLCHVFGHITRGCPGPVERKRIRMENNKRVGTKLHSRGMNRDPSRGRDTEIRGSANSRYNQDHTGKGKGVWKPLGVNQNNGYKGMDASTSADPLLGNRFRTLHDAEQETNDHMVQETPMELQLEDQTLKEPAAITESPEIVEDSECEEGTHMTPHDEHSTEMNVTLRGDRIGNIDPLEFPLLEDTVAAGAKKKKAKEKGKPKEPISLEKIQEGPAMNFATE